MRKPAPRLWFDISYLHANKGPDYPDNREEVDPITGEDIIFTYPFQDRIIWEKTSYAFQTRYEIVNDLNVRLQVEMSDVRDDGNVYTPSRFQGEQITTTFAISAGF